MKKLQFLLVLIYLLNFQQVHCQANNINKMDANIVGVWYAGKDDSLYELTKFASKINEQSNGKLQEHLQKFGALKLGKTRILYDLIPSQFVVLVGLGDKEAGFDPIENVDIRKENVRKAIGAGVQTVASSFAKQAEKLIIDDCADGQSASEGAALANYLFDELKAEDSRTKQFQLVLNGAADQLQTRAWNRGHVLASWQNVCKRLMELPANILTPTKFAEEAERLTKVHGVKVIVHDRAWAEEKKMGCFLSVANGSAQPPKFVELHYKNLDAGDDRPPVVLVGKGITFDTGGISIKPASLMDRMRADMGGAANVLSTIGCLAEMKAKANVIGLIPLTENMPSGSATKPGDVCYAMNGMSVQIDHTDAEGRLVLSDGLCYADTFNPELSVTVATLTGAVGIALGEVASAVYSTNDTYWDLINQGSKQTGDRVWRMPLFSYYTRKTKDAHSADMTNISKDWNGQGGSCVAAAFLREFTKAKNWMHMDVSNVKYNTGDIGYLSKGMTGRPLRTITEFLINIFAK